LPEGTDSQTIKAAAICVNRKIARCQLFGDKTEIFRVALQQGIDLPASLIITEPKSLKV